MFYIKKERNSFTQHQLYLLREMYGTTKYPPREHVESLKKSTNSSTKKIEVNKLLKLILFLILKAFSKFY